MKPSNTSILKTLFVTQKTPSILELSWDTHSLVLQVEKGSIQFSCKGQELCVECKMEQTTFEAKREGMDLFNFYMDDHKGLYFLVDGKIATFFKNNDCLTIQADQMQIELYIETQNLFAAQIAIGQRFLPTFTESVGSDKRIQIRALKDLVDSVFKLYFRVGESVEIAMA
jgi:hypothetical protein